MSNYASLPTPFPTVTGRDQACDHPFEETGKTKTEGISRLVWFLRVDQILTSYG
jgi:hypothetical protein